MKHFSKCITLFALFAIVCLLFSCSNSSGDNSSSSSTTGENPSSSSTTSENPFTRFTWCCDINGDGSTIEQLKFASDYTMIYRSIANANGQNGSNSTHTMLYEGTYTVQKDYNGVSGQFAASFDNKVFVISNKDATTGDLGTKHFIEK